MAKTTSHWRAVAIGIFGIALVVLVTSMTYMTNDGGFTLGAPPMENIIACLVLAAGGITAVYLAQRPTPPKV